MKMNWYKTICAEARRDAYLLGLGVSQEIINYLNSANLNPQQTQFLVNKLRQNPQTTLEELKQIDAARLMHISRPTFSRIVALARKKVADGLVNIKVIQIEGGCCRIKRRRK